MVDPLTAMTIAGGALNIGKSLFGAGQLLSNRRPNRPKYEIPESVKEMLGMARSTASMTEMPGMDVMEGNIGAATATAMGEMRRGGRGDISSLHESQLDALRGVGAQNAQFRMGNIDKLMSALGMMGGYEDKAWEYNEAGKYADEQADYYAKRQSGMDNMFGGMSDAVGIGLSFAENKEMMDIFDRIYGKKDPVPSDWSFKEGQRIPKTHMPSSTGRSMVLGY
jgi:hypothetical protein